MSTDIISLGISRQGTLKDHLSPYKIAVLILIKVHCRFGPHGSLGDIHNYSDVEELTFLTTLLQLIQVLNLKTKSLLHLLYRYHAAAYLCCMSVHWHIKWTGLLCPHQR